MTKDQKSSRIAVSRLLFVAIIAGLFFTMVTTGKAASQFAFGYPVDSLSMSVSRPVGSDKTVLPGLQKSLFADDRSIFVQQLPSEAVLQRFQRAPFVSSSIVISQIYGGGGNAGSTYTNDFIEVFNRGTSTVNVAGWSVQYTSATGTTWAVTNLTGSIAAGKYFLIQEAVGAGGTTPLPAPDVTGTIAMSATAGKVALVNTTTAQTGGCPSGAAIVDFNGYGTTANCFEGTSPAPAPSSTNGDIRGSGGCTDTDQNATDFTAIAPTPRNSATAANSCGGGGPTNPAGVGAANPNSVLAGGTTLLTVTVTPGTLPTSTGLAVSSNLSSIGGSATQTFFDNGTNGDVTVGDNVYSYQATVTVGTTAGSKSLPFTITDAQMRTGSGTISLGVTLPAVAVHDIQGSGSTSPLVGQVVTTNGIVTGLKSNGFFLQTPDAQADANPNTSEGIFVFTSSAPPAAASIGNSVNVTGTVQEFIPSSDPASPPQTELVTPSVTLNSTGNPLPAPHIITAAETTAPSGTSNPLDSLEEFEGMRVAVPSLTVSGSTQGTITEPPATVFSNGVFIGVVTGVARPFREPGIAISDPLPAGAPGTIPRFDENPERIRVDSDAQPGTVALDVTAGTVITNITGPLDYGFRAYTIDPDAATPPTVGAQPGSVPVPSPSPNEFTVASFNMQRFFDTADDPSTSDPILTAGAFARRVAKASLTIRTVQGLPDVIGVEEMENLTTLQTVATQINTDVVGGGGSNPNYMAYLAEGNDIGGIDVGFLVKLSKINVIDVTQLHKTTTYTNPNTLAQDILNDRPPLQLRATALRPGGGSQAFTVIVNHLRSLSGVDDNTVDGSGTAGGRVRAKRRAQAEDLAGIIQARQAADPTEWIITVGDMNAFRVNDGYVDSIGTILGTPAPASQVTLASTDLVNPDQTDLIDTLPAAQQYSYNFDGNAQTLDHVIVNPPALAKVTRFAYARDDSDFAVKNYEFTNELRISDHDQPIAYFDLTGSIPPTPTPTPAPRFEGDINRTTVGVPGTGDGDVNAGDQLQYIRFLNGSDCPSAGTANPALNEQQRLDAGPRTPGLGDGLFGASDGTAIDAYGRHDALTDFNPNTPTWDPTPAGGPAAITNLGCIPTPGAENMPVTSTDVTAEPESATAARTVKVISATAPNDADVFVDIELESQGDEAGLQFSLVFDGAVLTISNVSGVNTNPDITPGSGAPAGTSLNINAEGAASGHLGILANFNGANTNPPTILTAGTRRVVTLKFHVRPTAPPGTSPVFFDTSPVNKGLFDQNGFNLPFPPTTDGTVTVGALQASISGRVTTPSGTGLRNATVFLQDSTGVRRTATTSSFGFYQFDNVDTGKTYTMGVISRLYRFANRSINLTGNLTNVDFVGLE